MSKLKVNELDTRSGTTITVAAGKTLAGTSIIGSTQITPDSVTYDKIQDTTTANRVLGAISAGTIGETEVVTNMVADNAVTLAKMAGLVRGKIIVGDASGDPSALTVGSANQVLTSDGTDVSWAAAAGGSLPSQTNKAGQKLMTDGTNASWEPSPGRNFIINGQFDVWQRGPTITNGSNLAMGYSADRWRDEGYAWTGSVSRQPFANGQTTVPDNPTFFLRWIVTANPSGFNALVQRIENNPVNRLSGKVIVVSFWIKSASGTLADGVVKMYGKSTLVGSGNDNIGAITTTWQKITVTGTLPTITSGLWTTGLTTDAGTTFSSGVDTANWQVEIGDTPTAFDQKPFGETVMECQRYFEKSYGIGVAPGATSDKNGTYRPRHPNSGTNGVNIWFKVTKRIVPTIVFYAAVSGNTGKITNMSGGASDINCTTESYVGESEVVANFTSTGGETNVEGHWTASAEN